MSVISRFLRSAVSNVFWSRTDRMLRPRRSWIGAKMTLATFSPAVVEHAQLQQLGAGACAAAARP